jgi:protein-S-isoprenylcysteine O-methyltransferase Ste14
MMRRLELKLPSLALAGLLALAMWLSVRIWPGGTWAPAPALRATLALTLVAAGALIAAAGVLAFRRARTTVDPRVPQHSSALVVAGIYRLTRNPMYVGFALALAGWALWLAHPVAAFGPLLFVLWIDRLQIAPEERALRGRFGSSFDDYCGRTRRWL